MLLFATKTLPCHVNPPIYLETHDRLGLSTYVINKSPNQATFNTTQTIVFTEVQKIEVQYYAF